MRFFLIFKVSDGASKDLKRKYEPIKFKKIRFKRFLYETKNKIL